MRQWLRQYFSRRPLLAPGLRWEITLTQDERGYFRVFVQNHQQAPIEELIREAMNGVVLWGRGQGVTVSSPGRDR